MRYARVIMMLIVLLAALSAWALESLRELSSVGSSKGETSLGDLVADAVLEAMKCDCAFLAAGSLREITIPKGNVTEEQVLSALQYPNDRLAVIEITGEDLLRALERSVSVYPQKSLGFLQVSGITFVCNLKAEVGKRVSAVKISDKTVEPSAKYRIAMPEPLARGGNGYFTVWGKTCIKEVSQVKIAEAVKRFLAGKQVLDYPGNNRIVIERGGDSAKS